MSANLEDFKYKHLLYTPGESFEYQQFASTSNDNVVVHKATSDLPSSGVLQASAFSQVEQDILNAANPIDINETELITINGQTGLWSNRQEVINWSGPLPITKYSINYDENPEIIRKHPEKPLFYEEKHIVRYLRPPTPPPPGEIIIKQEKNIVTPPAPPFLIRMVPSKPETPPPLVLREVPPQCPAPVSQKVVTISGKQIPPVPRKVVIERLAPLPKKPQSVIIERWLPYRNQKRRIIFSKLTEQDQVAEKPKNVVVQWEAPEVVIKREYIDLGVVKANPDECVANSVTTKEIEALGLFKESKNIK